MKASFFGMLQSQFQMLHEDYPIIYVNSSTPRVMNSHDKSHQYRAAYLGLYPWKLFNPATWHPVPTKRSFRSSSRTLLACRYIVPAELCIYWESWYLGSSFFFSQISNCTAVKSSLNLETQTTSPYCSVYSASNEKIPPELDAFRSFLSLLHAAYTF